MNSKTTNNIQGNAEPKCAVEKAYERDYEVSFWIGKISIHFMFLSRHIRRYRNVAEGLSGRDVDGKGPTISI